MTNNSSTNSSTAPRWTFGSVVRRKPIKFLALTALFTYLLLKASDLRLGYLFALMGIKHLPTPAFVLLLAAHIAVCVFAAGTVLKVGSNFALKHMDPADARRLFETQNHFFWSRLYGLVAGYLVLAITFKLATSLVLRMELENMLLDTLLSLAAVVVPLLLANLVARLLNRVMIKATGTNRQLIADFRAGRYTAKVPKFFRNTTDMAGILKTMENAEAGTLHTAVLLYGVKKYVGGFLKKVGKVLGVFTAVLTVLAVVLGMGMSNTINNEIERDMAERRAQRQKEDLIKKVADEVRPSAIRAGEKAAKDEFYRHLR